MYAELDRLDAARADLDPARLADIGGERRRAPDLAAALENDLQRAALSLRPDLEPTLDALRDAGALGAAVSGSGPTCFGLFEDRAAAEAAASAIPGSLVTESR